MEINLHEKLGNVDELRQDMESLLEQLNEATKKVETENETLNCLRLSIRVTARLENMLTGIKAYGYDGPPRINIFTGKIVVP